MKIKSFLIASLAAFSLTAGAQSLSPNTKWHWDKGTIVVETQNVLLDSRTYWDSGLQSCRPCAWDSWVLVCVDHGR